MLNKIERIIKNCIARKVISLLFPGFILVIFFIGVIFLASQTVNAAPGIRQTINFQGKLVDDEGLNVADSTYSVVFTLYDAASGGTQLWQETRSVTTGDGIFREELGTSVSLSSVVFNNDSIYLGIKVGADSEMTPRVRFTATPYAFQAQNVPWSGLQNAASNLALSMGSYTSTFTYGNSTGANDLFKLTDTASNSGTGRILSVQSAAGSTVKPFHVSAGGVEALLVDANGNVGIGTTNPTQKLDINGTLRLRGQMYDYNNEVGAPGQVLSTTADGVDWIDASGVGTDNQTLANVYSQAGNDVQLAAAYGDMRFYRGTTTEMLFLDESSGNVGIGTTNPTYKLSVNGNVEIVNGSELYSFGSATLGNRTYTTPAYVASGQTFTASIQALDDAVEGVSSGVGGVWNRNSGSGYLYPSTLTDSVGIGTSTPTAKLQVVGNIVGSTLSDGTISITGGTISGVTSIAVASGTQSAPSYTFSGDANTGVYSPAADTVGVGTSGVERIRVAPNGNVGIGTTNPGYRLDVSGDIRIANGSELYSFGSATLGNRTYTTPTYVASGQTFTASIQALDNAVEGVVSGSGGVWSRDSGSGYLFPQTLTDSVGIGTSTPSERLHVIGNAIISGNITSGGIITGTGSGLTGLNASNLASGTVPSARITGNYGGITGVGTITSGTWQGSVIDSLYLDPAVILSTEIDTYSELDAIVSDVTLTHNGLIDTYTELNTIVADVTLTHNGLIDTYTELNAIVADVTLTHNGLIDTSSEIAGIVGDETGSGALVFANTPTFAGDVYFPGSGIWHSSGNVGIGTTNPQYDLDVNGDIRIASGSELYSFGSATLGNRTYTTPTYVASGQTFTASIQALDNAVEGVVSGSGGVWSRNAGLGYLYPQTITDSVGIGTSTPSERLHVIGNAIISGNITSGGIITGTGSGLTGLNASNLASGTVPSARITGNYGGITGVGTITSGTWQGSVISSAYLDSAVILSTEIDTYAELDAIVSDVTLTHNGLIDTSAEIAGIVGDETGSGALVFATSPVLVTPNIGAATGTSLNVTGAITAGGIITGTGSGLTHLNASNLTTGTVPDARIAGAYTNFTNITGSGNSQFANFRAGDGSRTAPSYSFTSDTNMGMYRIGTDILSLVTAGEDRLTILAGGNVGIGNTNPTYKLSVNGGVEIVNGSELYSFGSATLGNRTYTTPTYVASGQTFTASIQALDNAVEGVVSGSGGVWSRNAGLGYLYPQTLTDSVGIGTSTPTAKLQVVGNIVGSTLSDGTLSITSGNIDGAGNITAGGIITGTGSGLTGLNASNLASGTVPSARITGNYGGITGVGTITSGTWQGSVINSTYLDPAVILSTEIDTYSELNAIVADVTLTHNGLIDTYTELNTIVADVTLTHNGLIDTSAEIAGIVGDETGSGSLVFATSPVLVTPDIGAATGTSLNVTGAITAGGIITGTGSGLTGLNASNLASGTVPDARISGAYTGFTNITGSGTAQFGNFRADSGSVSIPAYSFTSDTNMGMYRLGTDILSLATAGADRLTVLAGGNVGIGTTNPGAKLEVAGQVKITGGSPGANKVLTSDSSGLATWQTLGAASIGDDSLDFDKFMDVMTLDADTSVNQNGYDFGFFGTGNVGIGTSAPSQQLEVAGNALFTTNIYVGTTDVQLSRGAANRLDLASGDSLNLVSGNLQIAGNTAIDSSRNADFATSVTLGGDVVASRGAANRLDLASGDSLNLVSGNLQIAGNTAIDSSRNADFATSVTLGADVVASRGAANRMDLASGDSLNLVSGNLQVAGTTAIDSSRNANFATSVTLGGDVVASRGAANRLDLASGDSLNLVSGDVQVGGTSVITSGRLLQAADGSRTAPSFTFSADTNTGMYRIGTDILSLATAGADQLTIFADGSVGIGTTTPGAKLGVNGDARIGYDTNTTSYIGRAAIGYGGGYNDSAYFGHLDLAGSAGNYALIQTSAGATLLNAPTGSFIDFRINNTSVGQIEADGDLAYDTSTLFVDASSNEVGIGTTNPGAKLEVAGQVKITGGSPGVNKVLTSDSSGLATWETLTAASIADDSLDFDKFMDVMTLDADTSVDQNGYDFSFFNTGNVGIGTSTPAHKLDVSGNALVSGNVYVGTTDVQLSRGAANRLDLATGDSFNIVSGNLQVAGTTAIDSSRNANFATSVTLGGDVVASRGAANRLDLASGDSLNLASGDVQVGGTSVITSGRLVQAANGSRTAPSFTFSADTNTGMYRIGTDILSLATAGSDRLTVLANGRVGIGTTAPESTLHVEGDVTVGGTSLSFEDSTTGGDASLTRTINFNNNDFLEFDDTLNRFRFNADATDYMVIDDGNVGIGTTVPNHKLEVSGNGLITGNVYVGTTDVQLSRGAANRLDLATGDSFNIVSGNLQIAGTTAIDSSRNANFATSVTLGGDVVASRGAANRLDLASGDSLNLLSGDVQVGGTSVITSGRLVQAANGSRTAPSFTFSADTNTGMYRIGNDILSLSTAGSDRLTVLAGGNVGIGTTNPGAALEVTGQVKITGGSPGVNKVLVSDSSGLASWTTIGEASITDDSLDFDKFRDNMTLDAATTVAMAGYNFGFHGTGNVGIGHTVPTAKLHVVGTGLFTGNVDVQSGLDVTGASLTVGGSYSWTTAGVIAAATDETINGIDISAGAISDVADITLNSAGQIDFADVAEDKAYWYSNTYGTGVEGSTLTNWSASQFRWRVGGTSATTGTEELFMNGTTLRPGTNGGLDLGSSTVRYGTAYVNDLCFDGGSDCITSAPVDGTGTANRVTYWSDTDTIAADDDFFFDGTNVGIGTITPQGLFSVELPAWTSRDTDAQHVIFGNSTDNDAGLRFGYNQTQNIGVINVLNPAVAWGDLILQDAGGNVGIGTTAPEATLELFSATQLSDRILLSGQEFYQAANTSTSGVAIQLGVNRTTNRQLWISDSAAAINATNAAFRVLTGNTYASIDGISTNGTATRDLILNAGGSNVGIGITSPTEKLHVVGNSIISGNLSVGGLVTSDNLGVIYDNDAIFTSQEAQDIRFTWPTQGALSTGSMGTYLLSWNNRAQHATYVLSVKKQYNSTFTVSMTKIGGSGDAGFDTIVNSTTNLELLFKQNIAFGTHQSNAAAFSVTVIEEYSSGRRPTIASEDRPGVGWTAPALPTNYLGSGNVGIGTGAPSQLLDVAGNAEINGAISNITAMTSVTNGTMPKIVLDSTSTGDNWTAQGAYISLGESGDLGSAALHMTYRGDGYGFIGSGAVANAEPGASYLRFDYDSNNIYSPDTLTVGALVSSSTISSSGNILNTAANGDLGASANFVFRDTGDTWLRLRTATGGSTYADLAVGNQYVGSGLSVIGTATLSSISGSDQTIENNYGNYLHLGAWAVARTATNAVLVNTAYRSDILSTARTINGVSFNGSANITVEPYIEDDDLSAATRYLTFTDTTTAGYKRLNEDSQLTYNPSLATLYVPVTSTSTSVANLIRANTDLQVGITSSAGFHYYNGSNDLYIGGVSTQDGNIFIKDRNGVQRIELNTDNVRGYLKINGGSTHGWTHFGSNYADDEWMRVTTDGGTAYRSFAVGKLYSGTSSGAYANHICSSGAGSGTYGTCSSSARYKENFQDFDAGLAEVMQMQAKTFNWKYNGQNDFGFIAEDLEKINTEFVFYNEEGLVEGVKYDRLTAVLATAIQEQQAQIASMSAGLNTSGELALTAADTNYSVTNSENNTVLSNTFGAYSVISAYLKTGKIETYDLSVKGKAEFSNINVGDFSIGAKTLSQYIEDTVTTGQIFTTLDDQVTTQQTQIAQLDLESNILSTSVASQSASLTSVASRIDQLEQATNDTEAVITSLQDRIAALETMFANNMSTNSAMLFTDSPSATVSANIARSITDTEVIFDKKLISEDDLTVLGSLNTSDIGVTGTITSGLLTINGFNDEMATPSATISTLGGILSLQHDGMSGIEFVAGKVAIDVNGNVLVREGDVEIENGNLVLRKGSIKGSNSIRGIDVAVTPGTTELIVTFTDINDTDSYAISVLPTWFTNVIVQEKTIDGFKILFDRPAPVDATIDWLIVE